MYFSKEHREKLSKATKQFKKKQREKILANGVKICTTCGEEKPLDEFYRLKKNDNSRRAARCKICQNTNYKKWASTPEAKKRGRERRRARYDTEKRRLASQKNTEKRRSEWAVFLIENNLHKCSSCGYERNWSALDYHHTNPETKDRSHKARCWFVRPITEKRKKDLLSCICLCANCHREIHNQEKSTIMSLIKK